MTSTPGHAQNLFVPKPTIYIIGDHVEDFLEEVHRFYELTGAQGQLQKTFIKAFLSAEQ